MSHQRPLFASVLLVVALLVASLLALPAALGALELDPVVRAIESGDLAAAESLLREHLAAGDDPVARDLLGVVLTRQQRYDEAEEQYLRALRAAPELQPAHQHLARLYLLKQRVEEATTALRRAAELGPLERDLALRLAAIEIAADRPQAAEAQLRSLVERFASVRALHELAQLRWRRGDGDEAIELLRRALDRAPNSSALLDTYARIELARHSPVTAILALETLVLMHPSAAELPYLLGVAQLQIGDMAGAVESLERAVELDPGERLSWVALGLALNNQKRYAEARDALLEGLRLAPDSPEALAALAEAEAGSGDLDAAELHARRALSRDGEQATAHLVLGLVRMEQQRYAEARDALEAAIGGSDEAAFAKAHYQLSLAYARLGDAERSRHHLELYRQALAERDRSMNELRGRKTKNPPSGDPGA